jgi:hypothetical protein
VVEADTLPDALTRTCLLGINPGGEAMLIEVPAGTTDGMPSEFRDVLLSRADLDALDGMLGAT